MNLGDPVQLNRTIDELPEGSVGIINSLVQVEGVEYAYFMPSTEQKNYVLRADALTVLDEQQVEQHDELKALLELIKNAEETEE